MTLDARIRAALDAKAKPPGSLGRLEDLAVQLGVLQGTERPVVHAPVVLVVAGDHGAAPAVSSYPQAVTAAMVRTYGLGRAAVNVLAAQAGARVIVVDAGVLGDPPPGVMSARLGPGTRDWRDGPAMTEAQADAAFAHAARIVGELARDGTTVLGLGEMGIGNTASAGLIAHKLAGLPLLAGPGAGQTPAGLARKQAAMDHGAARTAPRLGPIAALVEYGGFEIAVLAGAILHAATAGLCVVVDGAIVTAAALVAHAIRPECLACCVFAHRSAEPGHAAMLRYLDREPLLDLGLRLGEGTGAALAIPLLRAACGVLEGMAELSELA